MTITTTTDVRVANTIKVYSALRENGPMTRRQLADAVDLTFASVSSICSTLLDQGMLVSVPKPFATGGRNAQALSFVPEFAYSVVLDMHHTDYIIIALVDLSNRVLTQKRAETAHITSIEALGEAIAKLYQDVTKGFEGKLFAISIGVSAVFSQQRGVLMQSSNPLLERVDLKMHLRNYFPHLPILIENDANLAAYSQLKAMPNGQSNHLFLLFTQGIGLGVIVDGKLYHGSHGFAGELGHLKLTEVDRVCSKCGNVGCMRTVVPITTIAQDLGDERLLKEIGSLAYSTQLLERSKNEPRVVERIEFTALKIGEVLAELFDILNPQRILLGGNNWKLYPLMSNTIRQRCRTLSNLAREVDLQIQFVDEPINQLIITGAAEHAFTYFTQNNIPVPQLFTP